MGKIFEEITTELREWIGMQKMFFVATAPLSGEGHINCSPKGLDSFRILSPTVVAYQDLTGSGIETVAHIRENSRIVVLFCAFEGKPRIVRLHGKANAITRSDPEFENLSILFPERPGIRSYIKIHLTRISNSCGFGVPLYDFKNDRKHIEDWSAAKGDEGILHYRQDKNSFSIDGLKGLKE